MRARFGPEGRTASAILARVEISATTLAAAREAVAALDRDGSPVAWPESANRMVDTAWRRWQSFQRRHRKGRASFEDRVEDLAKGLRDAFEQEPRLAGPVLEDYRHVATVLGRLFEVQRAHLTADNGAGTSPGHRLSAMTAHSPAS